MPVCASSPIPTGGAEATRTADILPLPFPARPQTMTGYVQFIELGNITEGEGRVFHIGASNLGGALFFVDAKGGGFYRVDHDNGPNFVVATLAVAPSIGDEVELVAQLNTDGSVKLIQSINGAASTETATSSALIFAQMWGDPLLWLNSHGSADNIGIVAIRNIVFERGVQTLETMRRLAGV